MAPIPFAALSSPSPPCTSCTHTEGPNQRVVCRTAVSFSAALAQQPALSAAQPDFAVLGRQYRARPLCCGSRAADDAVLRALDRRFPDAVAVRSAAHEARLAGLARALALAGAVV